MTPEYYQTGRGDLYEEFREHYGYMFASVHLLMEAQQYLFRCRSKGQYLSDLKKVKTIMERLIAWEEDNA